jgi:hypothetical protein
MGEGWTIVNLDKLQSIFLGKLVEFFWAPSVTGDLIKPLKLPESYATRQNEYKAYKGLAPKISADFYKYISLLTPIV